MKERRCGKSSIEFDIILTQQPEPTNEGTVVLLPAPISSISDRLKLERGDVYIEYIEIVPMQPIDKTNLKK